MSRPISATVTLDEDQLKEAILQYLASQGFEPVSETVFLRHTESGREGVAYSASASCKPASPAKTPPFHFPPGVRSAGPPRPATTDDYSRMPT